jgi:non-specific serine/threonine protein kinase
VGDELAGYRLRGVLGRGGMSVVYEAENPRLGSTVALKVLAPELATDDVFRARFLKESRTAASLNHPNVIPIYDMGTHEDLLFIAMRYVAGQDLRAVLKAKHVLAPEQALLACGQAGRALDVAHRHGLVHRDVKPGNILVEHGADEEEPDHIYLTDFGITKHAASRSGLTATGEFMGTIDYIAPEQIQGRPVDGRADIYSLGCVLYECLTGRVPFAKDVDAAVIWAHVEEMPTTPSSLQPTLPREIDEVIGKALAKDPADRYATCREFIAAARGAFGAPAATGTGTSHTATILAGPAAAAAAATAAAPAVGRDATAPQQAPSYFPPAPPGPARERAPGGAPPAGPPPGGKPRIRLDRRLVAGLSALALVIVAVGGFLIYRSTTGGSSTPAAGGSPTTAQPAGWKLGAASPFPGQQLRAAELDGKIWLAGGLTGNSEATDTPTKKTEYYDLAAGKWHAGPDLPFAVHHAILVPYQGKLWLIGGFLSQGHNLELAASNKVLFLDPAKGRWVESRPLNHARTAAAAVVVNNEIVVIGGRTGGKHPGEVKQTEIFNGTSWHDAADIPVPGDHLAAVTDGKYVYALGGRTLKASANHNAVQRFDPATNTWTQLTPLPIANSDFGAAYVGGQLITFGGENGLKVFGTVQAYNLASKTWSTLPSMADPRHGMGATVVGNTIYCIDGASLPGHNGSTNTLQTFVATVPPTPVQVSGVWTGGHFSPYPVQQLPAAVLNQSQVWVAGGLVGNSEATDTATKKTEYYDTQLRLWNSGPDLPFAVHHAMMVNYRNQLYLIGGFLSQGHNLEVAASNKVLKLDAATSRWVEAPPLHHARAAGAAVVVNNEIVVIGGRTGGQRPGEVAQTEIFNGTSWHDAASIPVPGDHLAAVTDGTDVYALGGRTLKASANHSAVQRFDPATNTWSQLTNLPVANSDFGAAYLGGELIIFGGENGLTVYKTTRAYNLTSKTWSTLPNLKYARHGMGATVVGNNTIYAMAGASLPGHNGSNGSVQLLRFTKK